MLLEFCDGGSVLTLLCVAAGGVVGVVAGTKEMILKVSVTSIGSSISMQECHLLESMSVMLVLHPLGIVSATTGCHQKHSCTPMVVVLDVKSPRTFSCVVPCRFAAQPTTWEEALTLTLASYSNVA